MKNHIENILRSKGDIEEIVTMVRLNLYNRGLHCGPKKIREKMIEHDDEPLPSERTISRILVHRGLTNRRTGWYPGEELNG